MNLKVKVMNPREYTEDEVRKLFLDHVKSLVEYVEKQPMDSKEKLNRLAFCILSTIDGSSMDFPAFILAPYPSEGDKQFYIDNDKNYYPENNSPNVNCDIAGNLHELFYNE
jgi:hypothetical protein